MKPSLKLTYRNYTVPIPILDKFTVREATDIMKSLIDRHIENRGEQ